MPGAVEQAIEAPGLRGPLRGVLLQADRPGAPVALLIPGSGPTDRDGNGPLGLRGSTYRLLAEGLAARGIAVARVDKRGMFGSAQAVADANAVSLQDYVADVHAWVDVLCRRTSSRTAWVIGHSEGGLVALAAGDGDPRIRGAVLIATPGRRMGDILREQLRANPANAPVLEQAFTAIAALEAGGRVDASTLHPALLPLFRAGIQGFLANLLAFDPQQAIANYRKPVLVLQGTRDLQVPASDARLLAQAAPQAGLVLLPDANHVLKRVASPDRAENLATYADPGLPLADGVVDAIAGFIGKNGG